MIASLTGIVAGLVHVFSGPDHLAAVAPLALENRRRSWRTGLRWGLGHTSGVVLIGLLLLMLRELLPRELISNWSERFVGVVLMGIGVWGFRKALRQKVHAHTHAHDGREHVHIHVHTAPTRHVPEAQVAPHHSHTHAAFAVGTLHGLAGSSHLYGVLPALAFPTRGQAALYLICYGLGTIAAMSSFAGLIGFLAGRCSAGGARAYQILMGSCSAAALAIGAWWLLG